MILLSGGSKSRHRGAGLIRNLLFSPETRKTVAQVTTFACDAADREGWGEWAMMQVGKAVVFSVLCSDRHCAGAWNGQSLDEAPEYG